jgi:hypothetical protein
MIHLVTKYRIFSIIFVLVFIGCDKRSKDYIELERINEGEDVKKSIPDKPITQQELKELMHSDFQRLKEKNE